MSPLTFEMHSVMPWGKHQGQTISQLLEVDPGYVRWLAEETEHELDDEVLELLEQRNRESDWRGYYVN